MKVDDVGDGLLVWTGLGSGDELEATDICNILATSFQEVVLVKVYDRDQDEIEAESCGDVT